MQWVAFAMEGGKLNKVGPRTWHRTEGGKTHLALRAVCGDALKVRHRCGARDVLHCVQHGIGEGDRSRQLVVCVNEVGSKCLEVRRARVPRQLHVAEACVGKQWCV